MTASSWPLWPSGCGVGSGSPGEQQLARVVSPASQASEVEMSAEGAAGISEAVPGSAFAAGGAAVDFVVVPGFLGAMAERGKQRGRGGQHHEFELVVHGGEEEEMSLQRIGGVGKAWETRVGATVRRGQAGKAQGEGDSPRPGARVRV